MRAFHGPRQYSTFLLLTAFTLNAVFFITLAYVRYYVSVGETVELDTGSIYPLAVPDILVTMEDTEQYAIYGSQANDEWLATTPVSNGYIHVGENSRSFALAFGHELHCMRIIRMAIAYPWHPDATVEHASHCLNYLRLYILCNPDLTLERFDPLEDDFTVERFGATHVCRDWKPVYDEISRVENEYYGQL